MNVEVCTVGQRLVQQGQWKISNSKLSENEVGHMTSKICRSYAMQRGSDGALQTDRKGIHSAVLKSSYPANGVLGFLGVVC